jgi:hypothetical protein
MPLEGALNAPLRATSPSTAGDPERSGARRARAPAYTRPRLCSILSSAVERAMQVTIEQLETELGVASPFEETH